MCQYHLNGMFFDIENLKATYLLSWSFLFENFKEHLKIGEFDSDNINDLPPKEIFDKCKPNDFSSKITSSDLSVLKESLIKYSMWYQLNIYHFTNVTKELKAVIRAKGLVKPIDFEGIYFNWYNARLKKYPDQVFYVNKENYYDYLIKEDQKLNKNSENEGSDLSGLYKLDKIHLDVVSHKIALLKELGMLDSFMERMKRGNPELPNRNKAELLCLILNLDNSSMETVRVSLSNYNIIENKNYPLRKKVKKQMLKILAPLEIKLEGEYI